MNRTSLFNSRGQHIANLIDGQLFTRTGQNIGRYLLKLDIFIDLRGRYLGEIVFGNRLLRRRTSAHLVVTLGEQSHFGDAGHFGDPGNYGDSGIPEDYIDIAPPSSE